MNKEICIYGIGKIGKEYAHKCAECGAQDIKIIDSDKELWGSDFEGILIQNPAEVLSESTKLVVIAVSDKYKQEVYEHLISDYKVKPENILFYTETLILSDKEIYNLGDMSLQDVAIAGGIYTKKELLSILNPDSFNDLEHFFFEGEHKILDKWFHYFEAYDRFFSKYRGKDVTILEIGVFKGGSLQMWKHYFDAANHKVKVYGIDINPDCKALEEENIEIFIGSQEDREFLRSVKEQIGKIDILIDDGGHTMNQQITTFEELFDLVSDDGIYLCEDLHTSYMEAYGGEYKGDTFIEYSKNLIDYLHAQYSESKEFLPNKYSEQIKAVTYYDSMIFIEKKKDTTKSISIQIGNK